MIWSSYALFMSLLFIFFPPLIAWIIFLSTIMGILGNIALNWSLMVVEQRSWSVILVTYKRQRSDLEKYNLIFIVWQWNFCWSLLIKPRLSQSSHQWQLAKCIRREMSCRNAEGVKEKNVGDKNVEIPFISSKANLQYLEIWHKYMEEDFNWFCPHLTNFHVAA